jgi:DNA-binding IclR family transcriptional regulator
VKPGLTFSLFKTCSGNAFVAFSKRSDVISRLDSDIVAAVAEGRGSRPDLEKRFWADIAAARNAGYSQTLDNPIPGVASIAAPVFGPDGDVAVVIALFGPKGSIDPAPEAPFVRALLSLCRKVSARHVVAETA